MNGDVAIINTLLDDAPVAALVGTRIYAYLAPEQTTLPYITVVSNGIEPSGTSKDTSSKIDVENLQVQLNDIDADANIGLGEKVRAALERFSGSVVSGGVTVDVISTWFEDQSKFKEREATRTLYITEHDYHVRIRRTPDYIKA